MASTNPTTTQFVHTLDGEPCDGPEHPDDALCQAHGRLWRAVATSPNANVHTDVSPRGHVANSAAIGDTMAEWLHANGFTSEDIAGYDADHRAAIARLSEVSTPSLRPHYVPSDQTWAACVAALRAKERHAGESDEDAFAGFPTA